MGDTPSMHDVVLVVDLPADTGDRFLPVAGASMVGQRVPITVGPRRVGWGLVTWADVRPGGEYITCKMNVTYDLEALG